MNLSNLTNIDGREASPVWQFVRGLAYWIGEPRLRRWREMAWIDFVGRFDYI